MLVYLKDLKVLTKYALIAWSLLKIEQSFLIVYLIEINIHLTMGSLEVRIFSSRLYSGG